MCDPNIFHSKILLVLEPSHWNFIRILHGKIWHIKYILKLMLNISVSHSRFILKASRMICFKKKSKVSVLKPKHLENMKYQKKLFGWCWGLNSGSLVCSILPLDPYLSPFSFSYFSDRVFHFCFKYFSNSASHLRQGWPGAQSDSHFLVAGMTGIV
jgi:hypothetical protein